MVEVTVSHVSPDIDPRLKPNAYSLIKKFSENGITGRFEVLSNHLVFEFPLPSIQSPYAVQFAVPHDRVVTEALVLFGEIWAALAREQIKLGLMNDKSRTGVA